MRKKTLGANPSHGTMGLAQESGEDEGARAGVDGRQSSKQRRGWGKRAEGTAN